MMLHWIKLFVLLLMITEIGCDSEGVPSVESNGEGGASPNQTLSTNVAQRPTVTRAEFSAEWEDVLSWLPPDGVGVLVLRPADLMGSGWLSGSGMSARLQEAFGIDPSGVKRLITAAVLPKDQPNSESPEWDLISVMEFTDTIEAEETCTKLLGACDRQTLNGNEIYRQIDGSLAGFSPSEQTLVIARPEYLSTWLQDNETSDSALAQLLLQADPENAIVAGLIVDQAPMAIANLLEEVRESFAPKLAVLSTAAEHLQSGLLAGSPRLDRDVVLRVELTGRSEAAARVLESACRAAVAQVASDRQRQPAEPGGDAPQALKEELRSLLVDLADAASLERQGTQISVECHSNAALRAHSERLPRLLQETQLVVAQQQALMRPQRIALALADYCDTHGVLPPAASETVDGNPLLSWRVHLLPFLGHEELYEQFHFDEAWDSPHNLTLLNEMPLDYQSAAPGAPGRTSFLAITGQGTLFEHGTLQTWAVVSRRLDSTPALADVGQDSAVEWTKPTDLNVDSEAVEELFQPASNGRFRVAFLDGEIDAFDLNQVRQRIHESQIPDRDQTGRPEVAPEEPSAVVAPGDSDERTEVASLEVDREPLERKAALAALESIGIVHRYRDRLQGLHVERADVGDDDLFPLRSLPEVFWINLGDTQVTDAGLLHLEECARLRRIGLQDTTVSDEGLKTIGQLLDLRLLFLDGTNVTDAGLLHLTNLKKLELLSLRGTNVTPEGVKKLKASLPDVEVLGVP